MSTTAFPADESFEDQPLNKNLTGSQMIDDLQDGGSLDAVPRCEKCSKPLNTQDNLACVHCGWYASIGSFVEIDRSWEASCDPTVEDEDEQDKSAVAIPTWAWIVGACVLAVFVESVAGRVLTPSGSAARTSWSLTQLTLGAFGLLVGHLLCFYRLLSDKTETQMLDVVTSPLKCWFHAAGFLPERQWQLHVAASGLMAIVMSLLVLDGIPYHRLWDWGIEAPPEQSLMAAVMSEAQKIEGDEDGLEEAVEGFAGSQDLDELGEGAGEDGPVERQFTDCVILGFQTGENGLVYSLILGVELNTKLVYAARVNPQLPDAELKSLTATLAAWKTRKPYIKVELENAHWVVPKQVCRVSYLRQGEHGWLYGAEFDKLRGTMNIPRP